MAINFSDSYKKISWDIGTKLVNINYFGVETESGRGIKLKLLSNSINVAPTTEIVRIYLEKPDNTRVYINSTIEGDYFVMQLTNQVYAVEGVVKAQFQINVGSEWVMSEWFGITVTESLMDGSIISTDDFIALQEALEDVAQLETTYAPRLTALEEDMDITQAVLYSAESIFTAGTGTDSVGATQDFSDKVEGQSNSKIYGQTAMNALSNGDFETTTGWVTTSSTFSVSNNIGTLLAAAINGGINKSTSSKFADNSICYYKADIKTISPLVFLRGYDGLTPTTKYHTGSGNYEMLSLLKAQGSSSTVTRMYIQDGRSSAWDSVYIKNAMILNLTAIFGAGFEPTLAQADALFDHYIDGMQGVGSGKIVSVGKNLFDGELELGSIDSATGLNTASTTVVRTKNYIKIDSSKTYKLSTNGTEVSTLVRQYDADKQYLGTSTLSSNVYTPTSILVKYIRFVVEDTNINNNIQIEEGSTTTTYEPYKSSILSYKLPSGIQLYSVPSAKDSVEEVDGFKKLVKKTKKYVLQASDITVITNASNLQFATIQLTKFSGIKTQLASIVDGSVFVTGYIEKTYINQISQYYTFVTDATNLYLQFPAGTYTDLAAVQTALAGTEIIYQLATPITYEDGDGSGFECDGNLEVFKNGTIYQEPSGLLKESSNATLNIEYNLSSKAIILSNSAMGTELAKTKLDKSSVLENIDNVTEEGYSASAKTVREKFDAVADDIGSVTLTTTSQTVKGAINELDADVLAINNGLGGTVLWTNPNTTLTYAGGTVSLSEPITNYNTYEVLYLISNVNSRALSSGRIPIGNGTSLIYIIGTMKIRVATPSGSSFIFGTGQYYATYGSATESTDNAFLIPWKVIGYKY